MFEAQYDEIAVDALAERIRTLGEAAPATYKAFTALSSIEEVDGVPTTNEMVSLLTRNHELVVKTCREALSLAQNGDDESSASLVSDRMRVHEKQLGCCVQCANSCINISKKNYYTKTMNMLPSMDIFNLKTISQTFIYHGSTIWPY